MTSVLCYPCCTAASPSSAVAATDDVALRSTLCVSGCLLGLWNEGIDDTAAQCCNKQI